MEKKQIGIVGAGLSGLIACKYALSKGFTPLVFESRSDVGGVWLKTLETTKLQIPKDFYQFSDFPWPSSVQQPFPTAFQVFDYIQGYADRFELRKHIMFDIKVLGVEYEGVPEEDINSWTLWGGDGKPFSSTGKWKVLAQKKDTLETEVYKVDFLILAIGRFSDVPNLPEFPLGKGPEKFHGELIHSMDYSDMDFKTASQFVAGKRIAIVGFQKSALDIAMECVAVNGREKPCTILYKTKHWQLPDYLPWGIPLAFLYFNRFSELLVHKPGEGLFLSLLATFLAPVRWAFSKLEETYIKRKLRLEKFGVVPEYSFLQDASSCQITMTPENFYDKVEEGSIILKEAPEFGFCEEGITIDGEAETLKTDLVIFATGFKGDKKLSDMFVSQTFRDYILGSRNSSLPLYRECIHPRIPQLGVIGYSESLSNLYTSEMRCRWLFELLDGTFEPPSIKDMEENVAEWEKYKKCSAGDHYSKKSCIGALHIWYNDQLCRDMGWNPNRKKGFFADLFAPYGPLDYVSPSSS